MLPPDSSSDRRPPARSDQHLLGRVLTDVDVQATHEPTRGRNVAVKLLDEGIDGREAPLAANSGCQVDSQLAPVEVAAEADDVDLDVRRRIDFERWSHADIDRGGQPECQARVDARLELVEGRGEREIGRGEPDLLPAGIAAEDRTLHADRILQWRRCLVVHLVRHLVAARSGLARPRGRRAGERREHYRRGHQLAL